ncbi:MAG: hypothetical protein RMJ56_05995 [Gemmataceae bacterium]|nr:hypothetical protein [Gemmata sp.]MDW8197141.1 hypothetical protein [Gemmataceae bacterium]
MAPSVLYKTTPPRGGLAIAVGFFATWQLIYIPAANVIDLIPRRLNEPPLEPIRDTYQKTGTFTSLEPLQRAAEIAGDILDFWSEISGQEQGWSLFAPGPPPHSVFPAVELHFPDGRCETLLSPFEPLNKQHPPPRLPLLYTHVFNIEAQLTYPVWYAAPELVAEHPEWFTDWPAFVQAWQKPIRAYLAWRLRQHQMANSPQQWPAEVILKHRYVRSPRPGEAPHWTHPVFERPFARWRPADDTMEAFDVMTQRFVLVEAKR